MRAPVDDIRHSGTPSKLRKQTIAFNAAIQPTTVSELLNWITFERFDEILGTKVSKASILTDARTGR
jgi:hypothetical protein